MTEDPEETPEVGLGPPGVYRTHHRDPGPHLQAEQDRRQHLDISVLMRHVDRLKVLLEPLQFLMGVTEEVYR